MANKTPDKIENNQTANKRFNQAANAVGLDDDQKQKMKLDLEEQPDKDNKSFTELKEMATEYLKPDPPSQPTNTTTK